MRDISQELAERELGPQTEQEFLFARGRGVHGKHWTELDRALERRAGDNRVIDYSTTPTYSPAGEIRVQQEKERLAYLETLDMAKYLGGESWELSAEHESKLRTMQRENDVIKTRARERQQEQELGQEREL